MTAEVLAPLRITLRLLALTACIWHNTHTGRQPARSIINYDH